MRGFGWGVVGRALRWMRAQGGVQVLTVGALGVILGVMGAYMAAAWAAWEVARGIMAGPRVVVVLKEGLGREGAMGVARRIQAMEGVRGVSYVPKAEGLKRLRRVVGEEVLAGIGPNPLPDVLEVSLGPTAAVAGRVRAMERIAGVERVLTARGWMAGVERLVRLGREVVVGVGVVLVAAVAGVVGVVVELGMHARAGELALMRLLGASGWFIAAPVLVQAGILGLAGSVVGWGMLRVVVWILGAPLALPWGLAPVIPAGLPGWLWPAMAGVGVVAGLAGAGVGMWLAAGRQEL